MTSWNRRLLAAGVLGAILAGSVMVTPKKLLAQVKYALVRDEDSPGRNAIQASFTVNALGPNGLNGGSISIPAGKRLVVDYVEVHGTASSLSGTIQPVAVLGNSLNPGAQVNYYLPLTPEPTGIQQFSTSQKVAIYSDSMFVGMGYSGYAPNTFIFVINVSGHLIDMP